MSDQGEKIAKSFGGLGFYRGCSIIFGPIEKSATNKSNSLSPTDECDTLASTYPASNHLLELQKEIKEEEEEIFADINSLINSRSNLYFAFDDEADDGVNLEEDENQISTTSNHGNSNTTTTTINTVNYIRNNNNNDGISTNTINSHLIHRYHNHTSDEHLFNNDSDDLNDYQSAADTTITFNDHHNDSIRGGGGSGGLTSSDEANNLDYQHDPFQDDTEHERVADFVSSQEQDNNRYSKDQNEEDFQKPAIDSQYMDENAFTDCNEDDQQDYQAIIQQVQSNLPKPCVFFLEGNCRRSDCKYSHDLSNITCKYWIEGFCFKGELCPFLHSYNLPSDSSLSESDELKLLTKKELNPTFIIESEADFPSLPLDAPPTALNESAKSIINPDVIAADIKHQILTSNSAVVFKTVKKKRKRG